MAKTEVTHLLFLDLETTGVDENLDEIIEIGCVLTTTGLDCLADCSFPILPTEAGWERLNANEFVREMHEANGLLEELNSLRTEPSEVSDQYRPAAVAKFLIGWLKANGLIPPHG